MSRTTLGLSLFAVAASSALVLAQGRLPLRGTYDERLKAIEDRMDAVEDRLARTEEQVSRQAGLEPDRFSLASEAKLDRMEVRLIRLETNPPDCECGGEHTRAVLERLRSVERQLARLRYSQVR